MSQFVEYERVNINQIKCPGLKAAITKASHPFNSSFDFTTENCTKCLGQPEQDPDIIILNHTDNDWKPGEILVRKNSKCTQLKIEK